jgi:hypothetical protein
MNRFVGGAILVFALASQLAGADRTAQLDQLYRAGRWFDLRDAVLEGPATAFYRGQVSLAFHDWPQAEKDLSAAFKAGSFEAGLGLLRLYELSGRRQDARSLLAAMDRMAKEPSPLYEQYRARLAAAGDAPDQQVAARGPSWLLYSETDRRLIVPLVVNGAPANYALDPAADSCAMSAAEAARLGLKPKNGVTVAADIWIGKFHLKHVTFLVTPENAAAGTLGLTVLLALETVRWTSGGVLEFGFPAQSRNIRLANVSLGAGLLYAPGLNPLRPAAAATLDLTAMKMKLEDPDPAGAPSGAGGVCTLPPEFMCLGGFHCFLRKDAGGRCLIDRAPIEPRLGNPVILPSLDEAACGLPEGMYCEKGAPCPAVCASRASSADSARDIVRRSLKNESPTLETPPPPDYTFTEEVETSRLDAHGTVRSTSTETHEVMTLYGLSLSRLTRQDGHELPAGKARAEQARIDKIIEKRKEQLAHEPPPDTPEGQALREERRRGLAARRLYCGDEFLKMFDSRLDGAETVTGRTAWVVELNPRANIKADPDSSCADLKMTANFHFKLWIDQADYRWARYEADNVLPITWGKVLFRLPAGSARLVVDQVRHDDGVWLPTRQQAHGIVRVLLAATISEEEVTTYTGYRKFAADSRILAAGDGK